jgi:hypothetical protein
MHIVEDLRAGSNAAYSVWRRRARVEKYSVLDLKGAVSSSRKDHSANLRPAEVQGLVRNQLAQVGFAQSNDAQRAVATRQTPFERVLQLTMIRGSHRVPAPTAVHRPFRGVTNPTKTGQSWKIRRIDPACGRRRVGKSKLARFALFPALSSGAPRVLHFRLAVGLYCRPLILQPRQAAHRRPMVNARHAAGHGSLRTR